MRTKKIVYYTDLQPNWHTKESPWNPPFLTSVPFDHTKNHGDKRIKVEVEFPVFGDEVDGSILAESKEIEKDKGFKS